MLAFFAPNFVAHFFGNNNNLRAALIIAHDVENAGQQGQNDNQKDDG